MGDWLRAVILGVIEGLTEFLPVSSTGHMIIAMPLLGVDGTAAPWPVFLYFIQIGAILAVVVYFWRRLWRQVMRRPEEGISSHLLVKLAIGVLPGFIAGVTLDGMMEKYLEWPVPVAAALVIGAGLMVWIESRYRGGQVAGISEISLRQSLLVGLAQCAAVVPGTSRAMATIMGGMMVGLAPAVAAEFSFYLAIPTLVGAGVMRIYKHRAEITAESAGLMGLGFAVSFSVALVVVSGFMKYVQTRSLKPFAVYRVVLGMAVLAWWFWR